MTPMLPPPLMFGQDWARMGLGMSAFAAMSHGEEHHEGSHYAQPQRPDSPEPNPIKMPDSWAHARYGHQQGESIANSHNPWLSLGLSEVFKQTEPWLTAPSPSEPPATPPPTQRSPTLWEIGDDHRQQRSQAALYDPPKDAGGGEKSELGPVLKELKDVLKDLADVLREKKSDRQMPGHQADGGFVPMGPVPARGAPPHQDRTQYRPASPPVPHTSMGVQLPNASAITRALTRGE